MITLAEIEATLPTLQPSEIARLENILREVREQAEKEHREELYRRLGFRPFENKDGKTVTTEMVLQMCEEEGI